jgi:hypothetical protein
VLSGLGDRDAGAFRRFYAERMRTSAPLATVAWPVAAAVADWQQSGPLRFVGEPPEAAADEAAVVAAFERAETRRRSGVPELLVLADAVSSPRRSVFFDREPGAGGDVEYVWFSLAAADDDPELRLEPLLDLTQGILAAFGAHRACVEDEELLGSYRGASAAARARAAMPPELAELAAFPEPEHPDALPSLLVPQEFDRRRVPDAVWWINGWDRVQVETVGRDRVLAAPWHRLVELGDGGIVAAATARPPRLTDEDDRGRLGELCEALSLRELQERHRHEGGLRGV